MSRKPGKIMRDLLLGLKELPVQSGQWGYLLKTSREVADESPNPHGAIALINASYLEFVPHREGSDRGAGLFYGAYFFCLSFLLLGPLMFQTAEIIFREDNGVGCAAFAAIWGLAIIMLGWSGTWAWRSARAPLAPPAILAKKLRKFYVWSDKKGWLILDYDKIVPATFKATMVTTAGSATTFTLGLFQLEGGGGRRIVEQISPAPALARVEAPEEVWEFLRVYMDGGAKLPAIDPLPPLQNASADQARIDRLLFAGFTDEQHNVRGLLNNIIVLWGGTIGYWSERCGLWIQRTAPRPEYPPELREVMSSSEANPYETRPPTTEEFLAWEGRLPRLNRRYALLAVLSTFLYGGAFLILVVGSFSEALGS